MTQVGAPAIGEILADRYRIEEHVNDDSTGRQVWRGVDVILRRPITIVLRIPGGPEADEMLRAAVAASRVVHPNIVGVYDAIDEGTRAYVIREWVDGRSLRDVVREAPLNAGQAVGVARSVADALSAVHATGVSHGNVHPGTVLLSVDDRVVLGDARAYEQATPEGDVRAVGALLYFALTGYWPRHIAGSGPGGLPDAPLVDGRLVPPSQLCGSVPPAVDQLVMQLLDPHQPAPGAAELAVELTRLGYHENIGLPQVGYPDDGYDDAPADADGPLGFSGHPAGDGGDGNSTAKKLMVGVAALLVIALAGVLLGIGWNSLSKTAGDNPSTASGSDSQGGEADGPQVIALSGDMVRMVDPPAGDRQEGEGIELAVDGDETTGWATQEYTTPEFGNLKPGMGILINLGKPQNVSGVRLKLSAPGAWVGVRYGDQDYGDTSEGDQQIHDNYQTAAEPREVQATVEIPVDFEAQYVMVWITKLPPYEGGRFSIQVNEIELVSGAP